MPIGNNVIRTQEYKLIPDFFDDWTETHRRWSCYHHYGVGCCVPGCPRKGTHVVHWYSRQDHIRFGDSGKGEHIDLVGFDPDGKEFLMTVDHIVPDSKGGPKIWWNLQPMCEYHNGDQGNKMFYIPDRFRITTLANMAGLKYDNLISNKDLLDSVVAHFLAKQEKIKARGFRKVKDKY